MKHASMLVLALLILMPVASALVISSVDAPTLMPGKEGKLSITVKNTFDNDLEEVSLSLDLSTVPLTSVSSSEFSVPRIDSDDRETVTFLLRADTNAKTGDYNIPYTITYKNATAPKKGTIGIKISAKPDLSYTASSDAPVIGEKGKITLKLVNRGLGEARFVAFTLLPQGFTLLSEEQVYIGSINSDDFESIVFEVIVTSKRAEVIGTLEYRDSDNNHYTKEIRIPLTVYTKDEAITKGIITKSNVPFYIGSILLIVVLWLIYRSIAKRRRLKKSLELAGGR